MNDRSPLRASGCHGSQLRGRGTGPAGLIGLVTGGRSGERDRSLQSAEAVGEALRRQNLRYVRLDPL